MESSAQMDCEPGNEEDEDLEFFQKSIKVHDRFGGNCDEEDEFYSDDEPDEPISCPKGGYLKPADSFSRSILSSETKLETISMLDNVRSSCSMTGRNLSLEMLNLKSDEAGLGNLEDVFLGKSILRSSPPFGDPLSEVDILDSALSLLDDKTCRKFREEGLFDGLVDKKTLSIENEMKAKEEEDVSCHEAKLDLMASIDDWPTPEPYFSVCDSPDSLEKAAFQLIHDDVSKQEVHPSAKSEPFGSLLSCQIKKSRQSKSESSSRKQRNDSDSLESKGSMGREFPPNNLSLDDLVRYINGESLKKVCSRKAGTPAGALPQTTVMNSKKSKKQLVKKPDVAAVSKTRVPPTSNRLRKTTKKPNQAEVVRTEDFTGDSSSQEVFCRADIIAANSDVAATGIPASSSSKEITSASEAEHEDENAGQEEFIAVLHKKRVKTRKETPQNHNMHSTTCGVSVRTKVVAYQPDKASGSIDKDLGASTASVFSLGSKSYRSDTSGGSMTSKRGSLSSLDESPPLAAYEASNLGTYTQNHGHPSDVSYSRSTFSKFSTGNSYASALLQNMPKLSVAASCDVSQTEHGTVESATFSSPLNCEAENEMLLSPPQSEADTGFSSSSSLSPDEVHISLASDSTVILSKGNEAVDSEPKSCPSEESSTSLHPTEIPLDRPPTECVVQDSVTCHISNLDLPLTRVSELSGRTEAVDRDTGESSLACSGSDLSFATVQSKIAPVIFDARIRTVAHKMSDSDIVFLFDAEDSGSDAVSNAGSYVPVDDIDGITFTSSPDSMRLETGALEKGDIRCTVVDVEASFESYKPDREDQREFQVADDQGVCSEYIPKRGSQYENPVSDGKLVESSVSEALRSTSHGGFDLVAAQKFFSQAFKSVLKHERECPGQVVRL